MEEIRREVCPVCGSLRDTSAANPYDCPVCGLENAYVRLFAGESSRALRRRQEKEAARRLIRTRIGQYAGALAYDGSAAALIDPRTHRLTVTGNDGSVREQENVRQVSAGGRTTVTLFLDGSVSVSGGGGYGEEEAERFSGIRHVLAGPNCVYAVTEDGTVLTAGSPADPSVRTWTDVQSLACGAYHVIGLRRDGTVRIAGQLLDEEVCRAVEGWRSVTAIAAASDCSLGLHADGTVSFAGRSGDMRREAIFWQDVAAIAADSSYAVGLTKDGRVLLAGSCAPFLDMGRARAREWTDVVAIACGRSGIAALTASLTIRRTGIGE